MLDASEDSVDGFVADIVTRMLVAVQGQVVNTPTFASKDYENRTRFAVAYLRLAMIRLMLARQTKV